MPHKREWSSFIQARLQEIFKDEGCVICSRIKEEYSLHLCTRFKGMRVPFVDGQVMMWRKGKKIDNAIIIGEEEDGLYKLKGQPEQALVHDSIEPSELWH